MQSIAETCVRFDAVHLSINLVSEIAVPMFPTLIKDTPPIDKIELAICIPRDRKCAFYTVRQTLV